MPDDSFDTPPSPSTWSLQCESTHTFTDAGLYLNVYCGVCGERMKSDRNRMGPTSFVEAMAVYFGKSEGHLHDYFWCKYRKKKWHRQAKGLFREARHTSSRRLANQLLKEAGKILRTRKCTRHDK